MRRPAQSVSIRRREHRTRNTEHRRTLMMGAQHSVLRVLSSVFQGAVRQSLLIGVALLVLGGCTSLFPVPPPWQYFVLTPGPADDDVDDGMKPGRALNLGLVIYVPPYLDRPELVTRLPPNEFLISDTSRWAEPFKASVTQALARNLESILHANEILVFPWFQTVPLDYAVDIDVRAFEPTTTGDVRLDALWRIRRVRDDQIIVRRQSEITRPVGGANTRLVVETMSATLADLSEEIADAILVIDAKDQAAAAAQRRKAR